MNAKKAVLAVVVVFLGFWMFTDPNGLADTAKDAGDAGLERRPSSSSAALIDFVGALA